MNNLVRKSYWFSLALVMGLLPGCSSIQWDPTERFGAYSGHLTDANHEGKPIEGTPVEKAVKEEKPQKFELITGTGTFVKQPDKAGAVIQIPAKGTEPPAEGDITLNFDNTDLREVVKVILGDLLNVSYILDPTVQGSVTMQTGRPLTKDALLPTLETLLRMNKAALVRNGGSYKVLPLASAIQGTVVPQLGEGGPAIPKGYSIRIVPLRYIGATEMSKILTPLVPEGSVIRADTVRNLLILAGTSPELGTLLETISVFDVDWMKGLSVGVFRLENTSVGDLANQLDSLLGDKAESPLAGLFRIVPVESTNSLMVVTHQARYLEEIRKWIERLDAAGNRGDVAEQLFVYRVKHGSANNLASVIGELYSDKKDGTTARKASVAPGMKGTKIQSSTGTSQATSKLGSTSTTGTMTGTTSGVATGGTGTTANRATSTTASHGAAGGRGEEAASVKLESGVSIVADTINNSLLIRATPVQYRKVLDALEKLDILPMQVLVEATIVEVSLTGSLQYGLQWYLKGKVGNSTHELTYTKSDTLGSLKALAPGFDWNMVASGESIKTLLTMLSDEDLINVLSSPSVMVLDNYTAQIQVGNQVPILTSQQQSTNTDSNVVNSIQYKDTGVILSVTPRVTPGGLVVMDIDQEVSDVNTAKQVQGIDSPTISTRHIISSVAVKNNQMVVLGGLIRDRRETTESGIPGLNKVPVVGWAFGSTKKDADRTELVVMLTPKVITSDRDIEQVTQSFRKKLEGLREKF